MVRQPIPSHSRLVTVMTAAWPSWPVLWEGPLAAAVVGAGLPQGAQGGGVAAAFGGEVAAVAEHVGPAAERLEVWGGVAAEVPGGADQPALMTARVAVEGQVISGDPAGDGADRLG